MRKLVRILLASVCAAALGSPVAGQTPPKEEKDASKKKANKEKKETPESKDKAASKKAHPFNGKLASVDKVAKTITIGKSTYQMTSETIITKAGKPATLEDGVIGEEASGYAKPGENGKMNMTKLRFGPKAEEKTAEKKK